MWQAETFSVLAIFKQRDDSAVMKFLIIPVAVLFSIGSFSQAKESEIPAQVKIEEAGKQIAKGAQLLDVRTKEEWDEGHLKGAKLVTVTEDGFLDKAKAALDPEKPVVVYCRSGGRSATAAKQLRAAGFTVHDMAGGITAWKAAGKEVVK